MRIMAITTPSPTIISTCGKVAPIHHPYVNQRCIKSWAGCDPQTAEAINKPAIVNETGFFGLMRAATGYAHAKLIPSFFDYLRTMPVGVILNREMNFCMTTRIYDAGAGSAAVAAAISIALILVAIWRGLPNFKPTTQLSYSALLGSLAGLWLQHSALRRAAIAQGLISIGFSAFWSTLAVMLHAAPFHLGSAAAGAFGLAGAAGALAAPIAGRIADRRGPELVTRIGIALVALSFAAMIFLPLLTIQAQLWLLVVSGL